MLHILQLQSLLFVSQNQKVLYCQVCLHTQGICIGVRSFQYRNDKHSADKHIIAVAGLGNKSILSINSNVYSLCRLV